MSIFIIDFITYLIGCHLLYSNLGKLSISTYYNIAVDLVDRFTNLPTDIEDEHEKLNIKDEIYIKETKYYIKLILSLIIIVIYIMKYPESYIGVISGIFLIISIMNIGTIITLNRINLNIAKLNFILDDLFLFEAEMEEYLDDITIELIELRNDSVKTYSNIRIYKYFLILLSIVLFISSMILLYIILQ